MKKLFGGINLTWPKLIIFAILAGVYTALMAIIPIFRQTSFDTIAVTFEVWIFIGIVIIMNSKSNMDSALKCFIFFLISQPLVYLIQVPFSWMHWKIFSYYKFWFIWTCFCFPMGYIGYYMKTKERIGYMILFPMIILTGYCYLGNLAYFTFSCPKYLLICIFCAASMILYPLYIFNDKSIKKIGVIISVILVVLINIYGFMNPYVYNTQIMVNGDKYHFDNTYKISFEDSKYGDIKIAYLESIEDYVVSVGFKKEGKTNIILEDSNGNKKIYEVTIKRDNYKLKEVK